MKEKRKDRAAWSPSTLAEISQEQVRKIFFTEPAQSEEPVKLPSPPSGRPAYSEYPHAGFALPSEKLIAKVVKGETKDSGSTALNEKDVLNWFLREWDGKFGVGIKVKEVLQRRTTSSPDGSLRWR